MNKMKIIHLIQALENGGCENMLLRTLPFLAEFEHKIITLNQRGELAEQFEQKNISIININQKSLLDIFAYFRLLKEIKKEKPDLIFTYLFHADFVGRLFLQIFTNAKIFPSLRTTYNHKKYWSARLFEKITKYFVKQYLANSESVKDFYVKKIGVNPKKITIIPNGIDIDFYDKIERDENLRKNLGLEKEDFTIICVANLHINKGHKYLLKAFEEIYEKNKKIKLLLVGDGEEKNNLKNQLENYLSKENVLFLGKRNDVAQLLKISDIFVLPTLFEGMSNAIMEAMATGLPIITTDIPENRELIENEKTGVLVHSENVSTLVQAIKSLINNQVKRELLGKNAVKVIEQNYAISIIAKKIELFINSTIE